jgi:pyridoxal phosphate-dependent aminotransferase EpsN
MTGRIYLSPPHLTGQEASLISRVLESNWLAPLGPEVDGFETDLATRLSIGSVACLASGTAAIHLALRLLGVGRGDLVICPSFTFVATANPILYEFAHPVFLDSETESWNLDPNLLAEALESLAKDGKKPKAVIVVDLYGNPARYHEILAICEREAIPVIEDAAEALGSAYQGRAAGTFGLLGTLSFNGNKIITTSGGGALASNDAELISKARFLATQARDTAPHYQHSQLGYNYRMSNLLAAVGRAQLATLDMRVARRREIFENYRAELAPLGIEFPLEPPDSHYNRWLTTVLFPQDRFPADQHVATMEALSRENIESRPLWKPLHLQPLFSECCIFGGSFCQQLFKVGLCLPSGSSMTDSEQERVVEVIMTSLR